MNFDKLPNDIIIKILHQNKINKQNEMYKKRHNLFIKYLDYHFEEHGESVAINMNIGEDIRTDCEFLEYEEMWGTSFEKAIELKWGKESFKDFADNNF
tara:strand:+ start:189 stop:482 length:294 start_codon:yes stop_codon:yes gene_type:complete